MELKGLFEDGLLEMCVPAPESESQVILTVGKSYPQQMAHLVKSRPECVARPCEEFDKRRDVLYFDSLAHMLIPVVD